MGLLAGVDGPADVGRYRREDDEAFRVRGEQRRKMLHQRVPDLLRLQKYWGGGLGAGGEEEFVGGCEGGEGGIGVGDFGEDGEGVGQLAGEEVREFYVGCGVREGGGEVVEG